MLYVHNGKAAMMEEVHDQQVGDVRDDAAQPPAPDGMMVTPFDGQPLDSQPVAPEEDRLPDQ